MRHFSSLAIKNLTVRKIRAVLTVLGITLGVAIILAVNITNRTALSSYEKMLDTASGKADLQITSVSDTSFDEKILSKIKQTKGVKFSVPSVSYFTFIVKNKNRNKIQIFGIDPKNDQKLRNYNLLDGSFLKKSNDCTIILVKEYAHENQLKLGEKVDILTPKGLAVFRIVGLIEKAGAGINQNGKVGYIPLKTAQKIFQLEKKIQSIEIEVESDVDEVKKRLDKNLGESLIIKRPAKKSKDVENLLEATKIGFDFFSLIALIVGGVLIFNTFSMNISERVHEIGILRSVGANRHQILKIVLLEALALGASGCLLGVGLGINLARYVMKTMAEYVHSELGTLIIPPSSIILSVATGLLVTTVSAIQPALRAARISPLAAVHERGSRKTTWLETTGWIGGFFFIAVGTLITCLPFILDIRSKSQILYYQSGTLLLILGTTFVLPVIVSPLSYVFRLPLTALLGTEGELAQRNIQRAKTRTALTVVTLMVGLMMIIGIGAMNQSYKNAIKKWIDISIGADLFIHSDLTVGAQIGKTVPMSIGLKSKIKKVEGVKEAAQVKIMRAQTKKEEIKLVAVDPSIFRKVSGTQFIEGDEEEAVKKQANEERQVFASTVLKEKFGYEMGEKITLKTTKGWKDFDIVGIIGDFTSNQGGVRISWKDLNTYFGVNDVDSYDIKVASGYNPTEVKRKLDRQIAQKYGLEVWTSNKLRSEVNKELDRLFSLMNSIVLVAILVAILGVINTLFMNILERTREIGILRASGATRWQIAKIVVSEATFIGIIGGILGALFGIIASFIMVRASAQQSGFPLNYYFPSLLLVYAVIGGILISVVAAIYPAQEAARLDVTKALQYE